MSASPGRFAEDVPPEPQRLLVVGDVHGQLDWIESLIELADRERCQAIVQLGDLGYFPQKDTGRLFLRHLEQVLADVELNLFFLDGNHDDHDALRRTKRMLAGPFVVVSPHLFYLPRGCRWTWQGVRFLAVGGAHSIDRDWRRDRERVPRTLWWPEETISEGDVRRVRMDGSTEILLAHDCPAGVGIPGVRPGIYPVADENRYRLARIVDATRPELLLHAHYHRRIEGVYENRLLGLRVPTLGLAHEYTGRDGWIALDLEGSRAAIEHLGPHEGGDGEGSR